VLRGAAFGDAQGATFTKSIYDDNPGGSLRLDLAAGAGIGPLKVGSRSVGRVGARPVMAVCAFRTPIVAGFATPVLNTDAVTVAAGVCGRLLRKLPDMCYATVDRLGAFIEEVLPHILDPLDVDTDVSLGAWLAQTNYNESQRAVLLKCNDDVASKIWGDVDKRGRVGGFPKFQHFKGPLSDSEIKIALSRGIYARSNYAKIIYGPIAKAVERKVFYGPRTAKYFAKSTEVKDRPRMLMELFDVPGATVLMTDFSTFEATHRILVQMLVRSLLRYMTQKLPLHDVFMEKFDRWINGANDIAFADFDAWVMGRTQSGEMITSLSNSLLNLMCFLFAAHEQGIDWREIVIKVEGDDGATLRHPDLNVACAQQTIRDLGADLKLEEVNHISVGSFCGNVFSPRALKNTCDPWHVLGTMQWLPRQYALAKPKTKLAAVRAKAMSLLMEKPGPIVTAFAKRILRETSGVSIRKYLSGQNISRWEKARWTQNMAAHGIEHPDVSNAGFLSKVDQEIDLSTRLLVQQLYRVSPADQIKIERMFDGFEPVDNRFIMGFVSATDRYFFLHYSDKLNDKNLRYPDKIWSVDPELQRVGGFELLFGENLSNDRYAANLRDWTEAYYGLLSKCGRH